jgi:hypothetical protein
MSFLDHDPGPSRWGAGRVLQWVCVGLAGAAVAGAITVVLLPLPNPEAGGTCGPGRGAEPAIAAFFDPVSIGAGAQPPANTIQNYQWQAFVGECQSSTNARMVDALALLLLAGFFTLVALPFVRRSWKDTAPAAAHGAGPGWYPDPADPRGWRWWDGRAWSHRASAPTTSHQPAGTGQPSGHAPPGGTSPPPADPTG